MKILESFSVAVPEAVAACFALSLLCGSASAQQVIFQVHGQAFADNLAISSGVGDINHDDVPDVLVSSSFHSTLRLYSGRTHDLIREIVGELGPTHTLALGASIDGAGDFDGDGTLDLIAGAPDDSTGGVLWAGSARVYSGRDGHEIARWNGEIETGSTGRWVAGLGDVDGDGYSDVATAGLFERVWILGGPDMHLICFHDGIHTRPSVAGVGDIDMDSRPDYICGWPQDSTNGLWTGTATVFSGRNGAVLFRVYGETPQGGGQTGDHLGLAVSGIGDVNADGIRDFAVGAPGELDLTYTATHGMARVYSGVDASILWEWQSVDYTSGPHTMLGWRVDGGGDINGDGFDDVLASSPKDLRTTPTFTTGSVFVFSGRTGQPIWRVFEPEPSSLVWLMSFIGDVDGDGLTDFAMGNPEVDQPEQSAGRVTIYAGAPGDLERHCSMEPMASGRVMRLETSSSLSIGNNFLRLSTANAAPGGTAIFFYGPPAQPLPMAGAWLCTGSPNYLLAPPLPVNPNGFVEHALDFTQPPLSEGPSQVLPGSTWSFQLWCRDAASTGHGPLLSDGVAITFPP